MGDEKTATAAPKKKARARIKVVNEVNDDPIRDARVEITSQRVGFTDKKGIYATTFFQAGSYALKVFAAGFGPAGMNPRREFTYIQNETFSDATQKKPINEFTVRLAQALPRAKVTVTDPTRSNAPVPGVEVEITSQRLGRAGVDGVWFSPPFKAGKWVVKVRKPGYGPVVSGSAPKEGPVEQSHDFPDAVDTALAKSLGSVWGRVKSSNVTVGAKHFVDWFNNDFRGRMPKTFPGDSKKLAFPGQIAKGGFTNVFDNVAKLYEPELTCEEFIGICMIIYNETGGAFSPISEKGTPQYMFEPKAGVKVSYNQGGNRKAGDLLRPSRPSEVKSSAPSGAISTDEEIAQWNGTVWPNPAEGSDLHKAALECDFYKFRGRGLIQITWHSAYLKHVDPALKAAGSKSSDDLTEAELGNVILTDINVYLPMTRSYLKAVSGSIAQVNLYNWRELAFAVAGRGAKAYADLYEWRCTNLFNEMRNDGFQFK